MDDQPSFTPETKQTSNSNGNSGNTGKWKASDLYTEGIQNYIKKHSDSQFQKDDDMSFGSKQSIEKMKSFNMFVYQEQGFLVIEAKEIQFQLKKIEYDQNVRETFLNFLLP